AARTSVGGLPKTTSSNGWTAACTGPSLVPASNWQPSFASRCRYEVTRDECPAPPRPWDRRPAPPPPAARPAGRGRRGVDRRTTGGQHDRTAGRRTGTFIGPAAPRTREHAD